MRDYMSKRMRETFGPPSRTREGCDWWEFDRRPHAPLHVCLNAPTRPYLAHVLIFDPCATDDDAFVVDVSAHTRAEADAVLMQVRERMLCEA